MKVDGVPAEPRDNERRPRASVGRCVWEGETEETRGGPRSDQAPSLGCIICSRISELLVLGEEPSVEHEGP